MEISKQQRGDVLEMCVTGRLDNYWADFFAEGLANAIQEGAHHLRLDLAGVNYMSSAGIGILVKYQQQLQAIEGTLIIAQASDRVRSVLKLVALEPLLFGRQAPAASAKPGAQPALCLETDQARFDIYELNSNTRMHCRLAGDPNRIVEGKFDAADCRARLYRDDAIALGLGAFGADFADCRGRFGEFLALAGCAAHLPTDGTELPDFVISAPEFTPEVQVLYALEMGGAPATLVRFDAHKDSRVTLSELARQCLQISGANTIALAIAAEAATLVGAALRSSPDREAGARFAFPAIRDWVTFSSAVTTRPTAIIVGVCSYDPAPVLTPFVRTLDAAGDLAGHFHAALFPHRPIQRGRAELNAVVREIFQSHAITSVLHLLNDARPSSGAGETEFLRGACWLAPLDLEEARV